MTHEPELYIHNFTTGKDEENEPMIGWYWELVENGERLKWCRYIGPYSSEGDCIRAAAKELAEEHELEVSR